MGRPSRASIAGRDAADLAALAPMRARTGEAEPVAVARLWLAAAPARLHELARPGAEVADADIDDVLECLELGGLDDYGPEAVREALVSGRARLAAVHHRAAGSAREGTGVSRDFAAPEPRGGEAEAAACRKLLLAGAFEQLRALAARLERGGRVLPGDSAVENIRALLADGGVEVSPREVRDAAARLARAAAQPEDGRRRPGAPARTRRARVADVAAGLPYLRELRGEGRSSASAHIWT